jgi:hypothetical protein
VKVIVHILMKTAMLVLIMEALTMVIQNGGKNDNNNGDVIVIVIAMAMIILIEFCSFTILSKLELILLYINHLVLFYKRIVSKF